MDKFEGEEEKLKEVMPGSLHFPSELQKEIYVLRIRRAEAEVGVRKEK